MAGTSPLDRGERLFWSYNTIMDKNKIKEILYKELENNIAKHSIALAACMKELAIKTGNENEADKWEIAGLIHDLDYSPSYKTEEHTLKTADVLAKYDIKIDDEIIDIVKAHAPKLSSVEPKTAAQWSIFCADSLTGLIVAVALVYPSKKLADVKLSSVIKRFLKEPRFAAGTRREEVQMCEKPDGLNMPLDKFVEICLMAMQGVAEEIGL